MLAALAVCVLVALAFGGLVYVALAGGIPPFNGPYEDE